MAGADTLPSGRAWQESPPVELLRAVAVLAEPTEPGHAGPAEALGLGTLPDASQYADVFLFHLYPYASVYLGAEGMLGGEARDRVAGFWRAVGRTPPAEPDHLSALLGLYATLLEGGAPRGAAVGAPRGAAVGAPRGASVGAEAALSRQAAAALLHEHLAPWVPWYLDRVSELAQGFYRDWAVLAASVLGTALEETGTPEALPVHLRAASGLPDPRVEGRRPFLEGLLAPARCGVILTRADLARVAGEANVGVRAGERRYALENMMAQEPAMVMRALAERARVSASRHAEREGQLGPVARHLAERARATDELLTELAAEAPVPAEWAAP